MGEQIKQLFFTCRFPTKVGGKSTRAVSAAMVMVTRGSFCDQHQTSQWGRFWSQESKRKSSQKSVLKILKKSSQFHDQYQQHQSHGSSSLLCLQFMFLDKIGPFLGIIDLFLLQKKYAKILNLKLTLLDTFNNNQHLELTWGPILWQAPLIDLKDLPIFTIINHYSPTFQPMLAFYLGAHFVTSSFDRFERAADKRWGHKKRLSRKNIQSGRKMQWKMCWFVKSILQNERYKIMNIYL